MRLALRAASLAGVVLASTALASCGSSQNAGAGAPSADSTATLESSSSSPSVSPSLSPSSTASASTSARATATSSARVSATPSSASTAGRAAPAKVTKLLVFMVENHSLTQMRTQMPYTFSLAQRYAYASSYYAIRHPSLPNYLAIAGGSTFGVTDDLSPSSHRLHGHSVFGQSLASGRTAKVYADAMPAACTTVNSGRYAVRHNPWAYFADERSACRSYDLPLSHLAGDVTAGRLPNAGMVIPDICNDAHDCSLAHADAWIKRRITQIMSGPDWTSGRLAVVITADEDDKASGNRVLTVVASRDQVHKVVTTRLTHYSLTRLYDDVLGTAYLRKAGSAPSMKTGFAIPTLARP